MKRYTYEILSGFTGTTSFQLPVFLEASVDEMGIMSSFDGEFEQVEQFANFTYKSGFGWSAYGYYTSPFGSNSAACSSSAPAIGTFYIKEQYSEPTAGQYVYTNKALTTAFNGGYAYWRMRREDGQWFAAHIAPWGMMFSVLQCTSITPTPTPSETPCPVNPSVTPTISVSASIPATPTPTPTISVSVTPSVTKSPCPDSCGFSITIDEYPCPSITPTPTPSVTPTITPTRTPSVTPTRTPVATPSVTPSRTPSVTPTRTATPTPTPSTSHIAVPVISLWAVGGDFISKSTDEGVTWTQVYDTSGTYLRAVSFLNVNTGFAIGGSSPAKVFRTLNGGSSWSDYSYSLPAITLTRGLSSATHELSTDIYVGGNLSTFIRYNGSSWSDVSKGVSHNSYFMHALSSSTVLSTTSLSAAVDYGLRTTNSGSSWSEPVTFPQDQTVRGVDFNGTNGIMCSSRNSTSNKIFRSSDSGVSWSAQSGPTTAAMNSVSFPTATVAYMGGVDQTGLWGHMWKTINGGVSWTDITGNFPATTVRRINVVRFFDALKGWIGTDFSDVWYTTNGGVSWTWVEANLDNNAVEDMMMIVEYI